MGYPVEHDTYTDDEICATCNNTGLKTCPMDHNRPPNCEDDDGLYFHCGTCDYMEGGDPGWLICECQD